ncbi:hypothetical protein TIFTF001_053523 [Ficus carica]|uniref:Uncharacterized protein n=1 Tax=Ficus carica TaxID=3494 RepID=A0AA88JD20_FICCA|nr:hypothetical protein TIFTF001_053523 [Ficus carica]
MRDQKGNLRPNYKQTQKQTKEKREPLQPLAKPHLSTPEQPSVQSDHRGKKASNKEEKLAAREGHMPPMLGNASPRIKPTPSPPPPQPSSRGIHKPS